METNVVKERLAFVHDLESGHWSMTELCERYGVSRPHGLQVARTPSVRSGRGVGRPESRTAAVPASDG